MVRLIIYTYVYLLDILVHDNFVLHTVQQIRDFDGWRRRVHTRMLLPMQHHRRSLGEALTADIADVRSFPDVGQQMDLLRAEAAEGLAAYRAEIRLLARVCSQMLREAVLELELHTALLAHVLHLVQLGMAVKVLLSFEALSADLTLKLLHLGLVLVVLVKVQRAFAGVRGAAYVTHARLRVVVFNVRGIVRLHLEHLAALLAPKVVVLCVLANIVYLQIRLGARLKLAQTARVQLRRLVVDLHVPGKIRTGFEALGADCALVRPRVAVLEHVTSELALAVEADVADLADVRLFLQAACGLATRTVLREFVPVSFPEVQRRVVQIVEILAHRFTPLPGLSLEDTTVLLLFFTGFFCRLVLGIIFLYGGQRLFLHKHAQRLWDAIIIIFQFY